MILAINTSTVQFSLALIKEEGTLLAEYFISPGSKNFMSFMPVAHSLMTALESDFQDIKAVIVAAGHTEELIVEVDTAQWYGCMEHTIIYTTNDPSTPRLSLKVTANVVDRVPVSTIARFNGPSSLRELRRVLSCSATVVRPASW